MRDKLRDLLALIPHPYGCGIYLNLYPIYFDAGCQT